MKCVYTKNGSFSIYSKKQGGLKLLLMTVQYLPTLHFLHFEMGVSVGR